METNIQREAEHRREALLLDPSFEPRVWPMSHSQGQCLRQSLAPMQCSEYTC